MDTTRIENLTAEQEAQLAVYRDEGLRCGLSTEPADRKRAESAVERAYEAAGLKAPGIVIWLNSPLAGAIGAAMLTVGWAKLAGAEVRAQVRAQVWAEVRDQVGDQVWAQVRDQVWDQVGAEVWAQVRAQVRAQVGAEVGDQVWAQVWDQVWAEVRAQVWAEVRAQVWAEVRDQVRDQVWAQVRAQVWAEVRDQVGAQVRAQVRDQVWDQVGAEVWAQVRAQVRAQVGAEVGDQVYRCGYGQHDAGWLFFYRYFNRIVGLECCRRLNGLIELAESCGWCWPFAGAVILTERPTSLYRDSRNRLHRPNGAAIEYPDGWGVFAWHGIRVPEWLIRTPEQLTVAKVEAEKNAEIRRVMIERYGVARYMQESGAVVVHKDVDRLGHPRRLLRRDRAGDTPVMLIELKNSTLEPDGSRKTYHLRVEPELRPLPINDGDSLGEPQALTCLNAVASTHGMRGEQYQLVVET